MINKNYLNHQFEKINFKPHLYKCVKYNVIMKFSDLFEFVKYIFYPIKQLTCDELIIKKIT